MIKNSVPRVAAVHDLSGFGRASLTVVIPILSSMGIQVCPIPTTVLSSHSAYPNFHAIDLTHDMQPMIDHWKQLGVAIDAIYSGYLGAPDQVAIMKKFIADFSHADSLILVDPVLGDNGKLYSAFSKLMVDQMKSLVKHAQIITPNLTEAAFLLDEKYNPNIELPQLKEWIIRLGELGPSKVIITSVPDTERHNNTSVIAYNKTDKRYWKVGCDYFPAHYPGTGDAFASVVVGSLLQGDSLPIALDRAVQFISLGVRATFGYNQDPKEGILLEKVLPSLNAPVQLSSYQLLD